MPGADLGELMVGEVIDLKLRLQFPHGKPITKVGAELALAMFAEAVVAVEIIDHEPIHAGADPLANPSLEHGPPVGVVQAGPIFLHAANGIILVGYRGAVGIAFEQLQRIGYRLGAKLRFIPEIVIELEEPARPVVAIEIAYQKFDVEMADHRCLQLMQISVALDQPITVFLEADLGKMRGITAAVLGVR